MGHDDVLMARLDEPVPRCGKQSARAEEAAPPTTAATAMSAFGNTDCPAGNAR